MPRAYPPRRMLTDAEFAKIRALKGRAFAADVAERFGCARHTVHKIWQGRDRLSPAKPRAAAPAVHREGGSGPPTAALAPTPCRVAASLIARGVPAVMAEATAKAFRERHARILAGQGR